MLFNVSASGPDGGAAHFLLREEAALIQSGYIAHVVQGISTGDQAFGGELWTAISAFTPGKWSHFLAENQPGLLRRMRDRSGEEHRTDSLVAYLDAALSFAVSRPDVVRWLAQLEVPRELLLAAFEEAPSDLSSSECVLLAIPFMDLQPGDSGGVDDLVRTFCASVHQMEAEARQVVAEYGRRWEVLMEVTVPIGQLCTVQLRDQRPWIDTPSPVMTQEIVFGDSVTTHVEIRAADHSVVLDRAAVVEFITGPLIEAPRRVGGVLRNELEGFRSARRGTYRIDDENHSVAVLRVGHRRSAYS